MKSSKKQKNLLIFLFIFIGLYLWIYFLPLVGDDWGWGTSFKNIIVALKASVELWHNYNGRVLGHVLVFLMSSYPSFKLGIMALTFASLIYIVSLFASGDNKKIRWIIGILLIMGMPFGIYREVFAWMSGFSNFGIPVLAMSIYLCINRYIFEKQKIKVIIEKDNISNTLASFVLGFLMNLFAEHSALFSVILGIGMIIITYIIQKHFFKYQISFLVGSIIGCALMFASPSYWGTMAREVGTGLEGLSIFNKIIINIKQSTWLMDICINNVLLNAFLSLIFIFKIKNSSQKKLYIISTALLSLLSFICCPLIVYTNTDVKTIYQLIIVLCMFACVLLNFYILYFKTNKSFYYKVSLLYLLNYIAAVPLLAAVGFGPRCFINSYVLLCICVACICEYEIYNNKKFLTLTIVLMIVVLSLRLIATGVNYISVKAREKEIENLNNDKEIILEKLPLWMYVHQSGIPASPYHEEVFKSYYGIDNNVKIIIKW